jgi:hypothetical protein
MTYKLRCGCVKAHTCDAVVRRGEVKRGSILRACVAHGGSPVDPDAIPAASRLRYAAGRRVRVPKSIRTARDLIRRHLREEGHELRSLAAPLNVKPESVKTIMHHGRPLAPQHVDAIIEYLKLDEFDALELRLQGAIEAGWQIQDMQKARL